MELPPRSGPAHSATAGSLVATPAASASGNGAQTQPSSTPVNDAGPSYVGDQVRWPATIAEARTGLNAVPKNLDGHSDKTYTDPRDQYQAELDYGTFGRVVISREQTTRDAPTATGKKSLMSASNLLSASFGLGLGCTEGSYRGTAPKPAYRGGGPGVTEWTCRHTAWLGVAHDSAAARVLVATVRSAVR